MGLVIGEKRHLEKGDCSILMLLPNHKRRKVSVVRHFLHGCGPNALPIGMPSKALGGGTNTGIDNSEVQRIGSPEEAMVYGISDGVQASEACGLEIGKVVHNLLPSNIVISGEVQAIETRSVLEGEAFDTPKDLAGVSVQLQLLPHYPVPSNLVGKERKCPLRKRVSEVRTFPDGCGRNVPKPGQNEEKDMVEVETNNKINETAVLDLRKRVFAVSAVRTFPDGCGRNVPNPGQIEKKDMVEVETNNKINETVVLDLIERTLEADIVPREEIQDVSGFSGNLPEMLSDSDRVAAAQMIVYKTLIGSSSEIMGRCDRLREEAEQPVYDGNNENRDTHSLPDKLNETLIVYGRDDNNEKSTFGACGKNTELVVDDGADVAKGKKIIVQSLMCAALCPWRNGKGPVKASTSRNRRKVGKGKKLVYADEKKPKGPVDRSKNSDNLVKNSIRIVPYVQPVKTNQTSRALVLRDEEDFSENEELGDFNVLRWKHELAWKEMKQSKEFKVREGRCVVDISEGKESFQICAVNTVDDEKPPPFTYITSMMYPDWCRPIPPKGCDCKKGCSDSNSCACAVKNGGEIPFNQIGAILKAKALVYECGSSCKCPPSCCNRVSQHGIKQPLEIFKTNSMGWGVRCLSAIPSGSFICECIGELLDDKEAEQRIGSDEYLFDIGQNYSNHVNSDELSALMLGMPPTASDVVENIGFTIDAARYGNIGRFVNHSCSPNLYAQNVVYDHDDTRIPHVMLFAAENIPPLEELTYHYNYTIGQVFDSKGNIKKKSCYCGSVDCTGRLY